MVALLDRSNSAAEAAMSRARSNCAAANRTTDIYLFDVASGNAKRVTESRHDGVDLASLVRPD